MRVLHYCRDPYLPPLESNDQHMINMRWSADKPLGLWVTTEGDDNWPAWCRANEFRVDSLECCFEVWLRPSARILRIEDEVALREFDAMNRVGDEFSHGVRWFELVERYDGILIAPYQWRCRYDLMWYYGWDCASGVIWDVSAIQDTRLLTGLVQEPEVKPCCGRYVTKPCSYSCLI